MPHTFVLSDESVNKHGFWTKTAGISLAQFKKNPSMLFMHVRPEGKNTNEVLPIGYWDNIRIENNVLLADAVFDEADEFALKIKAKVENKVLRMASSTFDTPEFSELELKDGFPALVSCAILEASIVDRGSNLNSMRLMDSEGNEINLADNSNNLIPKIYNMKIELSDENKRLLSLGDDSTQADFNKAVGVLIAKGEANGVSLAETKEALKLAEEQNAGLELKLQEQRKTQFEEKLNAPELKLTEDKKNVYLKLAETSGYELAEQVLDTLPKHKDLKKVPNAGNEGTGDESVKLAEEYHEKHKAGTLIKLKETDPERFEQLQKAAYPSK